MYPLGMQDMDSRGPKEKGASTDNKDENDSRRDKEKG